MGGRRCSRRLTAGVAGRPMGEPRSVVITGASHGLGLASATRLYKLGWRVVAAMRSPDVGLEALRAATGARADDPRLIGVRLDLLDPACVAAAAKAIQETVGAPYALVHNAGIAAAGTVEELPSDVWEKMFPTHLFGPVALTKALLPSMRAARPGPNCRHLERGRCPRHARDRGLLRRQGRPRAVGRVPGQRGRTVRARGHRPGGRNLRHRHHH